MNLKIYTNLILIAILLFNSKNLSYAINLSNVGSHHVIGLSYKNDGVLSLGGLRAGDYYSNLTVQAGFAYNDFLAFQVGYHNFTDNPFFRVYSRTNYTEFTEDHFAHAGVGVFYPINIKNAKREKIWKHKGKWYSPRHILLDAYVAYGKGLNTRSLELSDFNSGTATFVDVSSNSTLNFNKWYAEGGLHYKGHIFGLSLSGVLGILNFRKITIVGLPDNDLIDLVDSFREEVTFYTYGYQVKVSYCFDSFTILYHNHQNFTTIPEFPNAKLQDYFGEFSVQVNISRFFKNYFDGLKNK